MSAQFKVGQTVRDDDYARLPVGSKVSDEGGIFPLTKAGPDVWMSASGNAYKNSGLMDPRILTHLGDGMADWERELLAEVDAEDKDDLYVEPEPLKEGDWVQVWAQVSNPELDYDGDIAVRVDRTGKATRDRWATVWARPDAIVRPDAGQVPPWLEAEKVESEAIANIAEVLSREGDMDYDAASPIAASLYRAGVRITEGGAS